MKKTMAQRKRDFRELEQRMLRELRSLVKTAGGAHQFMWELRVTSEGGCVADPMPVDAVNRFNLVVAEYLHGKESLEYADALYYAGNQTIPELLRCVKIYEAYPPLNSVQADEYDFKWILWTLAEKYSEAKCSESCLEVLMRLSKFDRKHALGLFFTDDNSDNYGEIELRNKCLEMLGVTPVAVAVN